MKRILVKSIKQNYPVFIGSDTFRSLPELIPKHNLPERIFVILDANVNFIFGKKIIRVLKSTSDKIHFLVITASEKSKSFEEAEKIFSSLYKKKFGRDTLVIAIGGGTIGDLAGFVASTYMRGVPIIHIPTTLLSMVDSSIGGKTGVNFKGAKNLVGTFYPPAFVIIDTSFLKSLPRKELISGYGEVIKYSYLTDKDFYSELLTHYHSLDKRNLNFIGEMIYQCVKIKSAVVSEDEFEKSGLRKILNLGHTFAHAYESVSGYKISHGQAVLIGILISLHLSYQLGLISQKQFAKMIELPIKFISTLVTPDFDERDILRLMKYDKKNRAGKNQFVLIKNFGEILVDVHVNRKLVLNTIREIKRELV